MRYRTIGPEALLDLAAATLRDELLAALPADKRYVGAMLANAIDIARRGIADEAETARFELLDDIYDDGDGTLAQLARDIRSGSITAKGHTDLPARLEKMLIAELAVANPRFLAARGIKTGAGKR